MTLLQLAQHHERALHGRSKPGALDDLMRRSEHREALIADLNAIDRERAQLDPMNRRLVEVPIVRAHGELTRGNADHRRRREHENTETEHHRSLAVRNPSVKVLNDGSRDDRAEHRTWLGELCELPPRTTRSAPS